MTAIGKLRMSYFLDFKLEINFKFQASHIYTVSAKEYKNLFPESEPFPNELFGVKLPRKKKEKMPITYLITDSTYDLEPYDSHLEGSAKSRPQTLVIQGILSFLTNEPFTIFQSTASHHFLVQKHISSENGTASISAKGLNLSNALNKILNAIECADYEKRTLLFTLFERWRKALYMERESEESYLYTDESMLAYVHILEVLADEYKTNLQNEVKENTKRIKADIIRVINKKEDNTIDEINSLLIELQSNQVTLRAKVIEMLKELKLYNPKSEAIVIRFIEHRNAIAHGRKNLYQDRVVFPLKPFFSFIKDIDENLLAIKHLAAKAIASYLGLNAWNNEWIYTLALELTPFSTVKGFIQKKTYKEISTKQFIDGYVDGIDPNTIAFYCIKKKVKLKELEAILSDLICTIRLTKNRCQVLFNAAILLSDSNNTLLANRCQTIIKIVHKNKWGYYTNMRTVLKEFEHDGISSKWFKEWLSNKQKT